MHLWNAWNRQIFDAAAVAKGNLVRRKFAHVLEYGNYSELVMYVRFMGYQMYRTGDQLVIVCNSASLRLAR